MLARISLVGSSVFAISQSSSLFSVTSDISSSSSSSSPQGHTTSVIRLCVLQNLFSWLPRSRVFTRFLFCSCNRKFIALVFVIVPSGKHGFNNSFIFVFSRISLVGGLVLAISQSSFSSSVPVNVSSSPSPSSPHKVTRLR